MFLMAKKRWIVKVREKLYTLFIRMLAIKKSKIDLTLISRNKYLVILIISCNIYTYIL